MVLLTKTEIDRGIYIDFEGNVDRPPTLLGAFCPDMLPEEKRFIQFVHEPVFMTAAEAVDGCVFVNLHKTFYTLAQKAKREKRFLFAWSSREAKAISELISDMELREYVLANLVDCKKIAKRWKSRFHRDVTFPYITGQGRHRLSEYSKLIGYQIPHMAGAGTTGKRLRDVRGQLFKRDNQYSNLTPVAKSKWKNLLRHNEHDCKSMRSIAGAAISDLGKFSMPLAA